MMQAVADVIGACPTQGLKYTRDQRWRSWRAAAKPAPSRPLPDSGAEWDLVRTCLRWDPSARVTMASAKQCAWFAQRVATPEAAPTSQTGTCADASTLSTACADASSLSAEQHRRVQRAKTSRHTSSVATLAQTHVESAACRSFEKGGVDTNKWEAHQQRMGQRHWHILGSTGKVDVDDFDLGAEPDV